MAKSLVFITKCLGSFAKYDPESSSLRMLQQSLPWGDMTYLEPLPRQGMMQNGVLYELGQILVYPISENDGFVLPTPLASDAAKHGTGSLHRVLTTGQRYSKGDKRIMLPTPTSSDVKRAKITPCDMKAKDRGYGLGLPAAVLKSVTLPTPTAKSVQPHHPAAWRRRKIHNNGSLLPIVVCEKLNITEAEAIKRGARLNPSFVEAMMGFPMDWTKPPLENTTND